MSKNSTHRREYKGNSAKGNIIMVTGQGDSTEEPGPRQLDKDIWTKESGLLGKTQVVEDNREKPNITQMG